MSSAITPLDVIQTAGVMRTFPEFANKSLSELISLAPEYLDQSAGAISWFYDKQRHEWALKRRRFSYEETAKLVTGRTRPRDAKLAFEKFREAIRAADRLTDETMYIVKQCIEPLRTDLFSNVEEETWPRAAIDWMRHYYSKLQKGRRKKS